MKQKIVKQADKWRNLPRSTTFCRNLRSWTELQAIKRKWASKINGTKPMSSKWAPHSLCHRSPEFRPMRSACCSSPPWLAPRSTGNAQLTGSSPDQSLVTSCRRGSTAGRPPAAMRYQYWGAPLKQGCLLKTISLTWSSSCCVLWVVWC